MEILSIPSDFMISHVTFLEMSSAFPHDLRRTYRILVPRIVHVLRHLAGQVPHLISLLGDGFVSRFSQERLQIKPSADHEAIGP